MGRRYDTKTRKAETQGGIVVDGGEEALEDVAGVDKAALWDCDEESHRERNENAITIWLLNHFNSSSTTLSSVI